MEERTAGMSYTDWTAEVLATDEELIVPIRRLWLQAQAEGVAPDLSLEDFGRALEADGRFEFYEGVDFGDGDPEERQAMEKLGYFSGPRVLLRARKISATEIAGAIKRSTDRMMEALQEAWNLRPQDDSESETELLELLAMVQQLQCEVDQVMDDAVKLEEPREGGANNAEEPPC
jgi:hypothetical protein